MVKLVLNAKTEDRKIYTRPWKEMWCRVNGENIFRPTRTIHRHFNRMLLKLSERNAFKPLNFEWFCSFLRLCHGT